MLSTYILFLFLIFWVPWSCALASPSFFFIPRIFFIVPSLPLPPSRGRLFAPFCTQAATLLPLLLLKCHQSPNTRPCLLYFSLFMWKALFGPLSLVWYQAAQTCKRHLPLVPFRLHHQATAVFPPPFLHHASFPLILSCHHNCHSFDSNSSLFAAPGRIWPNVWSTHLSYIMYSYPAILMNQRNIIGVIVLSRHAFPSRTFSSVFIFLLYFFLLEFPEKWC